MNYSWETLMFLSRLKVRYDGIVLKPKDKLQAIGVTLATYKAALIVSCIVQIHIQTPLQNI